MRRRNDQVLGFTLLIALSVPALARADVVGPTPIGNGAEYVLGSDPGLGTPYVPPTTPVPDSVTASNLFTEALGGNFLTTTVDFGPSFSSWKLSDNGVWTPAVNTPGFSGLQAQTTGIDYTAPPAQYSFGITNASSSILANADIGFNIVGTSYYEFVPSLTATTSSLTIHSDTAFEAFGFYLTGLGNQGGVVDVVIDGQTVQALTLQGSSQGGALYLGYIGDTPIHDLTLLMPDTPGLARDVFGISDITLGASVPEPSPLILSAVLCAGALGASALRRGWDAHRR